MSFVWLALGLVVLIKGADWMVQAASRLAKSFGISPMIIGLTVVAIGTSVPEAAIGIVSAIDRANQLTLGDVIGSSIANIALIIGISALFSPLIIQKATKARDIPLSFSDLSCFSRLAVFSTIDRKEVDRHEQRKNQANHAAGNVVYPDYGRGQPVFRHDP